MNNIFTQKKPVSYRSFLKYGLLTTASLLTIFATQPSPARAQTAIGQSILPSSSAAIGQNKSPSSSVAVGQTKLPSSSVAIGQNILPSSSVAIGQNILPSSSVAIGQNILPSSSVAIGETKSPTIKFSISPAGMYYFYKEREDNNKPVMDIRGAMGGFESNLQINFNPNGVGVLVIPFDLAVYGGTRMRYTGQDSSTDNLDRPKGPVVYGSLVTHIDDMFLFWTRSLIGPSIAFNEYYRINLLSGVGYKYTRNHARDDSQYYRTNNLVYLPLVFQFQYSKGIFSVLSHLEYDVFLSGWQTGFSRSRVARFDNPADSEYQGGHVVMKQTAGYGARAFVELNIHHFLITPFINYFWVKKSDDGDKIYVGQTTGHVYNEFGTSAEPMNYTIESGVKFGYQF